MEREKGEEGTEKQRENYFTDVNNLLGDLSPSHFFNLPKYRVFA